MKTLKMNFSGTGISWTANKDSYGGYAVISLGKGDEDNFQGKTLSKLKNKNIEMFKTDEDGNIVVTSNGKQISFYTSPVKIPFLLEFKCESSDKTALLFTPFLIIDSIHLQSFIVILL